MVNAAPVPVSNQIFNLVRGQEANFPFPVTKRTFTVGTFDAATGEFAYLVPTYLERFVDEPGERSVGEPRDPGPTKPKILRGVRSTRST